MKRSLIIIVPLLILSLSSAISYTELKTMTGSIYRGFVISETADSLKITTFQKNDYTLPKSDIVLRKNDTCTIFTKDDKKYRGELVDYSNNTLTFRITDGKTIILDKYDITSFDDAYLNYFFDKRSREDIEKGRKSADFFESEEMEAIGMNKDSIWKNTKYPMAGITILMPGVLNMVLGYNYHYLTFMTTFGLLNKFHDFPYQANVGYTYSKSRHKSQTISLSVGYSLIEDVDKEKYTNEIIYAVWNYYGLNWDYNYYGLFIELGLSGGSGTFKSPQIVAQIGYVYEFK